VENYENWKVDSHSAFLGVGALDNIETRGDHIGETAKDRTKVIWNHEKKKPD
jgi:hypothetical protein